MDRTGVYKMPSLKFSDSKRARAKRMDEQNETRRTARQARNNANRGLLEIDQNLLNSNSNHSSKSQLDVIGEIPHEQKLKERLAKLKVWREQKAIKEQRDKATKPKPFVVPGVARPERLAKETPAPAKTTCGRITRSQAKKNGEPDKLTSVWTVTANQPAAKKKPTEKLGPAISFAPDNFIFSAPKEVAQISTELQEPKVRLEQNNVSATPQRSNEASSLHEDDIKISPHMVNNPWITTTRGSSSKKERERMSLAHTPVRDAQASPCLKKRAQSLANTPKGDPDAMHFRSLMASEGSRLTDLCNSWEELLSANQVPEEEFGSVRTVIGQAQLLQRERFTQFAGLVNQFETKTGEKEITPTDLEGFWEMIYLQVSDVDKKFEELQKLKQNGWVPVEPIQKPRAGAKKKAATTRPAPPKATRSNMRAYIAAARKNQLAAKSPGSPSLNRRRSSMLLSPKMTPGKRQSLRRSVLISSAKKPVFIVTDIASKNSDGSTPSSPLSLFSRSAADAPLGSPLSLSKQFDAVTIDNDSTVLNATPSAPENAIGTLGGGESSNSEEKLSPAFDDLPSDMQKEETRDKPTPLKVFRTPAGLDSPGPSKTRSLRFPSGDEKTIDDKSDASTAPLTPRRSARLRDPNNAALSLLGRPSLLPVATISPVTPQDDLMSFD